MTNAFSARSGGLRIASFFGTLFPAIFLMALTIQPATAQEGRNLFALAVDFGYQETRPLNGADIGKTGMLLDVEYARSLWSALEVTFSGNVRQLQLDTAGTRSSNNFIAYQIGLRQYLRDPRRASWTPFMEGSVGEGWLNREEAGEMVRQNFNGFELGAGAALHFRPDFDLRIGAVYESFHARDKVGDGRDQMSRLGLRAAGAWRF